MSYSICNKIILFKYLENGQIKEKEVEIILPDRSELCNEDGLALVFELNKLVEKIANQNQLKLSKFLTTFQFLDSEEKSNFLNNQENIEPFRQIEIMTSFKCLELDYTQKDYLLEVYKVLIKKIYSSNYEPDFNWFNPSIQFENFVESYLIEYKKYQNVFLVTSPEVKEKQNQKTTGIGEPNKTIEAKKQPVVS